MLKYLWCVSKPIQIHSEPDLNLTLFTIYTTIFNQIVIVFTRSKRSHFALRLSAMSLIIFTYVMFASCDVCRRDSTLVKEEIKAFLGNRRISQAVVAQVTGQSGITLLPQFVKTCNNYSNAHTM